MNKTLLCLLLIGTRNGFGQQAPSFESAGLPFVSPSCEIAWSATTNQLPNALRVYRTSPQHFPDQAISNLVTLGPFTTTDKQPLDERKPVPFGTERFVAEGGLGYWKPLERRRLGVFPASGYVVYSDWRAYKTGDPIEDVPDQATTQELGLKLFDQFGFPRSELARRPNSSELLTYKVTDTRRPRGQPPEVYSRGVMFVRRIDGVNFAGIGVGAGFTVRFASHAKLAELELVWRNLQPYKRFQVANTDRISQWIKNGKAFVVFPDVDTLNPRAVRKLTITGISPLYMGELPQRSQEFTYPFASLDAIADTGTTNIAIQLYCPILTEEIAKP